VANDAWPAVILVVVLACGYLLPSIIMTLRGCRRAWPYWILNITLGWSMMMWAYLLVRAIVIDHENDRFHPA
jgi:hypothetical protein